MREQVGPKKDTGQDIIWGKLIEELLSTKTVYMYFIPEKLLIFHFYL